jgi:hypothetical protein
MLRLGDIIMDRSGSDRVQNTLTWYLTSDCLSKNHYDDSRCQGAVKALYECCRAFYERQGDNATTASCPQPDLLRLKIKQMSENKS